MTRTRFRGEIAGVGSSSGTRVVVGRWVASPLGSFTDAMVETALGHRLLVAPSPEVAQFVRATYSFDEVRIEEVATEGWSVRSASLALDLTSGRRTLLGRLLRLVPVRLAASPAWCTVTDPVARILLRGVRTRGSAGEGRRERYGATDHHAVTAMSGSFDGVDLGELRPVLPAPRFGFSSTPARPSITRVVTTVCRTVP
ncbi:MAG TPA: hypothetical protein VFJ09_06985 [Nocardioidaceae bacterium]|nr:hypothetical protein [Nocardioidaceae bacterium]